ncbi:TRAP transporter substrate-binding protein [Sedimentitalea nanhaiensis]|uniref:TRAP-type mannitol/chloroaromatic compound transport system, substrate-binding protein n=1 Tax=Sedimentitalea nanhaiensis TaxID=999627 RepID=A0A1I7BIK3_9RHOB|nr:TRAP transporter substrate-binding protein [Sedimentitalea nanhaiensis]SFT86982.1 TRAP-type mannitol/chloroaromatic compound transport system, substrate-binding protein [Sedimentitalea nanhaiensis]
MNTPLRSLSFSVIAMAAMSVSAYAADMTLKFQSSDPAGNPNFELQQGWAASVEERTGGKVAIELLPVTSIVAHNETQDAIAAGILDGHITDTSYFSGKDPAFGLIANPVGAWSSPQEMFDFMNDGGGSQLMNELLNPYGLQFIGATTPGLEAFVSKVPLNGVDDLQGLKMRAPEGLVQQVFAAAGAAPVNLPGSEVFTSLDKGVIDAADYSVFSTNAAQGMHDVATYPVYPGFHSMPLVEVSMNKAKWDSLDAETQAALSESVREFARSQVAALAARDVAAVEEAKAGGKVTVIDWPAEERAKFRTIAAGQWASVAERSTNAQHVYDVLTGYLTENGLMNQ